MDAARWARAKGVLHAALDRDPGERAAFLDAACADDPALRDEVDSLLAAHQRADRFLERPAMDALLQLGETAADPGGDALMPGSRLGPYEVVAPIAAGGMGEVYRARDLRLNRTVAIKVLPRALALDPDLRARLEREARALAALSHPQICALFDVGREQDIDFLVMELLDGDSLADRLKAGPLPHRDVLRTAIQMASALEAAHRQGVIHRDLKPRNIVLTKSGAKLVDFGLAKRSRVRLIASAGTGGDDLSIAGMLFGTVQYMAPEQLRGAEADARSDIFAFGAVLYEMLCGTPAFDGTDQASVIAAILTKDPPRLRTDGDPLDARVERVLRTCLAKDPDERWQSAADVRRLLEWIATDRDDPGERDQRAHRHEPSGGTDRTPSRAARAAWAGLGALLTLAIVLIALVTGLVTGPVTGTRSSEPRASTTFALAPPANGRFVPYGPMGMPQFAASPDGRRIAYVAQGGDGIARLWVRALDAVDAEGFPDTTGAVLPFWAPDGRSIGFFAQGTPAVTLELKVIDLATGRVRALCPVRDPRGGTWNREGVILFADRELFRIPAVGGRPVEVARPDLARGDLTYRWPSFLSDGHRFVVTKTTAQRPVADVLTGSLDGAPMTRLFEANSNATPVPGAGLLLFAEDGRLMAWPFDERQARVTGEPFAVGPDVAQNPQFGVASFSASDTRLLLGGGSINLRHALTWYDRAGRATGTIGPVDTYGGFRISPDGRRIAAARMEPRIMRMGLWIFELSRGVSSRVRSEPQHYNFPVWGPTGADLSYAGPGPHDLSIYRAGVDAMGPDERVVHSPRPEFPRSWSPDGTVLLYELGNTAATRRDLWVLRRNGSPAPFLATAFDERLGQFSPDGQWVAYESDEAGAREVYVCSFPSPSRRVRVSVKGGTEPRWNRNGRELFYLAPGGEVMAVPIRLGTLPEVGTPVALFRAPIRLTGEPDHFDVSPDGQRFLVKAMATDPGEQGVVTVMIDWPARLLQNR